MVDVQGRRGDPRLRARSIRRGGRRQGAGMNAPSRGVAVPDRETTRIWHAWPAWTLSALVALMPLSFSIEPDIKALPAVLLFFCGLALPRYAPVRWSYRTAAPVIAAA